MPFQKGKQKTGGRKKGVKNKTILPTEDLVTKLNVDPLEILMLFAKGDWKALGYDAEGSICYTPSGIEFFRPTITPEQRVTAATQAVKYIYSQKKAVELSNSGDSVFKVIIEDYTKKED